MNMEIVEFSPVNRNNHAQVQKSVTERELEKEQPGHIQNSSNPPSFFKKWWKVLAIIASIIVVIVIVLVLIVFLVIKKKEDQDDSPSITTSGACLRAARSARENVAASLGTSLWLTSDFLWRCRYSIGSSTVII